MARTIEGIGLGLRGEFADELVRTRRAVDWLEIIPEQWVNQGGATRRLLDACLERWPMVPHGTTLSVGGPDPLDEALLAATAGLVRRCGAPWWSDHLAWASCDGALLHELLPLPFTHEAVDHAASRAAEAQARAGAALILENPTYYTAFPGAELDEAGFLRAVLEAADVGLLLDVNNVYVNGRNHGYDPRAFLDRVPMARVRQIHVAGHTPDLGLIVDSHIGPVSDEVWSLYRYALRRAGRMIPTMVEWDLEIPTLDRVLDEVDRAREHARVALVPCDEAAAP